MADPLVERVLDVWTPRFLRVGVEPTDLAATAARIETWDDWCPQRLETAASHEKLADEWLELDDELSAVDALQRASIYYHVAAFVYSRDLELHDYGYRKMVEIYDRSLTLEPGRVEKVRFPFEETELVGLLSKPAGVERPPVVILVPGLDSSKEGRHAGRRAFLDRGIAVFSIDGPGQGEMSLTTKIRADYEAPVAAAIDHLETRSDVDPSRVALIGSSLGGYYAPRAAAYERRVAACVAISGPFTQSTRRQEMMPVTRDAYIHYLGARDADEADEMARALTLEHCADRIECPLLAIGGRRDPLVHWENSQLLYDAARGPKQIHIFDEGNHSCQNIMYKVAPRQMQFLKKYL